MNEADHVRRLAEQHIMAVRSDLSRYNGIDVGGVFFSIGAILTLVVVALLWFFDVGKAGREEAIEYDRSRLECRKAGGTYENFVTQGYHCIGGKQ